MSTTQKRGFIQLCHTRDSGGGIAKAFQVVHHGVSVFRQLISDDETSLVFESAAFKLTSGWCTTSLAWGLSDDNPGRFAIRTAEDSTNIAAVNNDNGPSRICSDHLKASSRSYWILLFRDMRYNEYGLRI